MESAYEIIGVKKAYYTGRGREPVHANCGITLSIPRGSIYGLFGPNGAGKSTLIRQMVGLIRPDSGSIHLLGRDIVSDPSMVPWYIGYCGQRMHYLWAYKPMELLETVGCLRGMSRDAARNQARDLIDMVGLGARASGMLRTFSGGEMRTVSVLVALMGYRPVIVLDEPTAELDPVKRQQVWGCLQAYNQEHGSTIVLVTHNVLEAEKVVHEVAIVDAGVIVAQGNPSLLVDEVQDHVRVEVTLDVSATVDLISEGWSVSGKGIYGRNIWKGDLIQTITALTSRPGEVRDLKVISATLEDYYVKVVGRQWR